MAWFAWQSALFILLGFALGVLVGYWFWRIQWRRVAFTESEAVTVISRRHERELTDKDAEIGRLQSLLAGGTGVVAGVTAADAADDLDAADDTVEDTADDAADDGAEDGADAPDVDTTVDAVVPSTGAEAADEADESDDALLADLDMTTVGEAAQAADADAVEPVTVVELPEADDVPAGAVVDVTDDALAAHEDGDEADRGAVAHALAQLPTQSTGEDGVVDVAEDGAQDATSADATGPDDAAAAAGPDDAAGTGDLGAGAPVPVPLADLTAAEDDESAVDGAEDDLERIEGIGPRIASALRTAGIRSFRRLADADVPTLQAALENAGLRFAPSLPTWSRQARFLADGDEVGFIKLTESLVAGREPGRSR